MESTAEQVNVRTLLEAGVHFGHQAKRWNPKMKPYIFAERAGVHIIDLDQTLTFLEQARSFVRNVADAGLGVLFVGTKKQAQLTVADQAMRCGQPYVAERYIGGMLTNFRTIQPRIEHFKSLAAAVEETPEEQRSGRDWFAMAREYQKLRRNFAGLTEMERLPGAVFVVDPKREELMVKEANRLRIPVVALTDTNCNPEVVDYPIPGNDDAIRSINLISRLIADSVLEGKGEDEVAVTDRPVPPVVEEARVAEEPQEADGAENGVADREAEVGPVGEPVKGVSVGDESVGPADEGVEEEEPPSGETPAEELSTEEPVAEGSPLEEPPVEEPLAEEPPPEESLEDEGEVEGEESEVRDEER